MGIFDNSNNYQPTITTKGFYFGSPEAEAENNAGHNLTDYFEDYLDILGNLKLGKFIFVGRKGVGKSAITKFIKDKSDLTTNSFATILRLKDFEIEKTIQTGTEEFKRDVLLFEWLILVNIVKLIVKNECGTYTNEFAKLKKFLDNNAGIVDVDKFQIDEGFKKSGGEINFNVLTHAFGGVFKKYFDVKVTKAPFYKLIPPLKEIVKIILDYNVNKRTEFWLLFDDLDVNFDISSDVDKLKVMELIRLAKNYNNEIFNNNSASILIFIRDDIRDKLISEYSDSAKIFNSYEISINWYNHLTPYADENLVALKKMINKRIEINFKNRSLPSSSDPWYDLFVPEFTRKSSFKYILDFTFYRPRDLITILNIVSDVGFRYPISTSNIKVVLDKYIQKNINEIKSELSLYFSETEKNQLFQILFKYISEFPIKSFDAELSKISTLNMRLKPEEIMTLLLSYSILVTQNTNGDLYYNYREDNALDRAERENLNINLHKSVYHFYKSI